MFERSLLPVDVELVLSEPDGVIPQSVDKSIFHKKLRGRSDNSVAVVAVLRARGEFEVLTVMIHFEVKL